MTYYGMYHGTPAIVTECCDSLEMVNFRTFESVCMKCGKIISPKREEAMPTVYDGPEDSFGHEVPTTSKSGCPYCGKDQTVFFNADNGALQCHSCGTTIGTQFGKYRKLPVIIQAYKSDREFTIKTLEGIMTCCVGDYVIKGVNGECYPCKAEIFHKTYEAWDVEGVTKCNNHDEDCPMYESHEYCTKCNCSDQTGHEHRMVK